MQSIHSRVSPYGVLPQQYDSYDAVYLKIPPFLSELATLGVGSWFFSPSHAESKDTHDSSDAYSDNRAYYALLIVERHIILDNTIFMYDFNLLETKMLM
jgi:hypothetical protein